MGTRQKVYGFLLVVALLGGGYALNQKYKWFGTSAAAKTEDSKGPGKKGEKEAIPVELASVSRGPISAHILSSGNIRPLREVEVATQIEGIVAKVIAEEGDFVKEGQVLTTFDDRQLQIRLELAEARLAQAKFQLEKARIRGEKNNVQVENVKIEYERYQKAFEQGLVSETEVAQRKYQMDELQQDGRVTTSETKEFQHRVDELEAEIAQAKLEITRTQIRAPFSGYITSRTVELGQRVRALDPLFKIGSFSPLLADVFVSDRDSRNVKPNQQVTIKLGAEGGEEYRAHVERISPIVDQATGTVKVTVQLNDSGGAVRPGAFIRVAIRTDTHSDALLIPKKAVLEEDGENYVYLADGKAAKRAKINVGYESDTQVEILGGLKGGEKVVVAGQGALKEGTKIQPQSAPGKSSRDAKQSTPKETARG